LNVAVDLQEFVLLDVNLESLLADELALLVYLFVVLDGKLLIDPLDYA
jgi:hypothetical protein